MAANMLPRWLASCAFAVGRARSKTAAAAVRASVEFSDYLRELIAERRRRPGAEDLVSALIAAHDEGDRLTEQEMISTCVLLLNAGHEATVNGTGNAWAALLARSERLAALRADHALVPSAVEELLRFDTPLQLFERWVLEDVEIDGTVIPRGAELALLFGSANRDPAVFAEPDRLDLTRRENPHISFGAGIHYCLGAPMARMELAASMTALLERAPGMRLAAEPVRRPNLVMRGLAELRVEIA